MTLIMLGEQKTPALLAQSTSWIDRLVSIIFFLPCAFPVIAVVILCAAMIVRQARNDRKTKN